MGTVVQGSYRQPVADIDVVENNNNEIFIPKHINIQTPKWKQQQQQERKPSMGSGDRGRGWESAVDIDVVKNNSNNNKIFFWNIKTYKRPNENNNNNTKENPVWGAVTEGEVESRRSTLML